MTNFRVCGFVFFLLSFFHISFLTGEDARMIPRKLLFGNPEKASPKLSWDGSKLAYLAPDKDNVLNVWIKDLADPLKEDRMVTADHKRGIRSYLWQFDNNHILYVQDLDGDENWHLFQTDIQTKETKNLTPYEGSKVDILDYDHKFPHEMLVQINHRNKSIFDVYRIDLKKGSVQLEVENPGHFISWLADHNLQVRAGQFFTKEGATVITVRDHVNAPWKDILTIDPNEIEGSAIGFTPNNEALYIMSSVEGNTSRLFKIPVSGGKLELVVDDPNYDLDSVMTNPLNYNLEAVSVDRDKLDWIILDPKLNNDFAQLKKIEGGVFTISSRTLSNRKWIVGYLSDQKPTHYYIYDRDQQKATFLFSTQPTLEKYELGVMTPISYKARDGLTIHGYLTLPPNKEPKNLSTVLLVHGGPWSRDSWGFAPSVQWLVNRGYAVLQINFRGSTGYGKAFLNAGNREWAGKMHTDLLDGKNWMIAKGYSDPSKVAIYGGSYGGYATLVALTFTPDEFCCGVDVVGPSNIITLLKTIPPYWGPLMPRMERRIGKLNEEDFLKARSPLYKAEFIKKPLLIAQGANDPRVKQTESDQIVAAIRVNKYPVEYLLFEDEGHGFAKPENRLKFYAAVEKFFAQYLGGLAEQPSKDEEWETLKR